MTARVKWQLWKANVQKKCVTGRPKQSRRRSTNEGARRRQVEQEGERKTSYARMAAEQGCTCVWKEAKRAGNRKSPALSWFGPAMVEWGGNTPPWCSMMKGGKGEGGGLVLR